MKKHLPLLFISLMGLILPITPGCRRIPPKSAAPLPRTYAAGTKKGLRTGPISEGLQPFLGEDDKVGFLDTQGKVVIEPRFSSVEPFHYGLAVAAEAGDKKHYGVIDRSGRYVCDPIYDNVVVYNDSLVALGKLIDPANVFMPTYKYAFADHAGKLLTGFVFYEFYQAERGLIPVSDLTSSYFLDARIAKRAPGLRVIRGIGHLHYDGHVIKGGIDDEEMVYDAQGRVLQRARPYIRDLGKGYLLTERKYRPNRYVLIRYPEISGCADKAAGDAINQRLRAKAIRSYGRDLGSLRDQKSDYHGDYELLCRQGDLLALKYSGEEYLLGAPHGAPNESYLHVNLRTGRFYTLKDLFRQDADYVKAISAIIKKRIEEDPAYDTVDNYQGIAANQSCLFEPGALRISFAPGTLAGYACGFIEFSIPYKEIADLIDTKGKLWEGLQGELTFLE